MLVLWAFQKAKKLSVWLSNEVAMSLWKRACETALCGVGHLCAKQQTLSYD